MESSGKGPRPRFREEDLWKTLKLIDRDGALGRKRIAQELELGEGSVRTVLDQLKEKGLAKSTPRGHSLTEKGKRKLAERSEKLVPLDAGDLTVGREDVALLVENASSKVRQGVEQRDEAIKAGAEGATVLVFRDEKFQIPGMETGPESELENKLLDSFRPSDGDVVIIGTGDDQIDAERGALAAAEGLGG